MDRLEMVRAQVDKIIGDLHREEDRKFAYIHLYGVSQCAVMLALLYQADVERCAIAAMLHDIALYALNAGHRDHAQKSAAIAEQLLRDMGCFTPEDVRSIIYAIAHHSEKEIQDAHMEAEILKDADVLERYLYQPECNLRASAQARLDALLTKLRDQGVPCTLVFEKAKPL